MIEKKCKIRDKFYRNKYLIALYDDINRLITICDNAHEFKDFLDIPKIETSYSLLSKLYLGKIKSVYFKGERLMVYFIPLTDYELKIFSERGN